MCQERVEEQLNAEIVHGAAEEDRCQAAGENLLAVEAGAGAFEHRELVLDGVEGFVLKTLANGGVGERVDRDGRAVRAAGRALEEVDSLVPPVVEALELWPVAERPVH